MGSANKRGKHVVIAELDEELEEMLENDRHRMFMNRSQYIRYLIRIGRKRLSIAGAPGKKGVE